jgi:hypothetical protein
MEIFFSFLFGQTSGALAAMKCSYSLHNSFRHSNGRPGQLRWPLLKGEKLMNGHYPRFRGAAVLGVLLLSVVAAVVAYNLGVSHGLAQQMVAQGAQLPAYPYPYGWYRPWGFGFGFPILFFVLIWFVLLRGLFWGRRWRHGYYPGWQGVPPAFDEWHRQAHERLKENRSADDPGRRG